MNNYTPQKGYCTSTDTSKITTSSDLKVVSKPNENECFQVCRNDEQCYGFHYDQNSKTCQIWKSGASIKGSTSEQKLVLYNPTSTYSLPTFKLLGCFKDDIEQNPQFDIDLRPGRNVVSALECRTLAINGNYKYFAVKNGGYNCFVGNTLEYNKIIRESLYDCTHIPCS